MEPRRTWGNTWRFVAGIGACLFMGYFGFVRGTRVPLLGLVDLGFTSSVTSSRTGCRR